MKKLLLLCTSLFILLEQANCYFFNLGHFLQPMLQPSRETFGSAIYRSWYNDYNYLVPFDSRQGRRWRERDQNRLYSINPEKKQNLRKSQQATTDLYKAIGVPEEVITQKILPVHAQVMKALNNYFYRFSISSYQLYLSLSKLKDMVHWIVTTYLKNINNVVLGDNSQINGHNVYVAGGHQKIEGSSNIVFNPQFKDKVVKGDNIVRIDRFDVDLDLVELAWRNPYKAVKLLEFQG